MASLVKLPARVALECFSFLDIREIGSVSASHRSFHKLISEVTTPLFWQPIANTFALADRHWEIPPKTQDPEKRVWKQLQGKFNLIKGLNAIFWEYYKNLSSDKTANTASVVRTWKDTVLPECEALAPREQFRKHIKPTLGKMSPVMVNKLVRCTPNPIVHILKLLLACEAPADLVTFEITCQKVKNLYRTTDRHNFPIELPMDHDALEPIELLLTHVDLSRNLDSLWQFSGRIKQDETNEIFTRILTMLLDNKSFKASPRCLHDAVVKPRASGIPLDCLSLIHEKTGAKPLPGVPDPEQPTFYKEPGTLDAAISRYPGSSKCISFMLKAGASPTADSLAEFLKVNTPLQVRCRQEKSGLGNPISTQELFEGVDLLLASKTSFKDEFKTRNVLGYGCQFENEELMKKLIDAGARSYNKEDGYGFGTLDEVIRPQNVTLPAGSHYVPSLESISLVMKYGARPTMHTDMCLALIKRGASEAQLEQIEQIKKIIFPEGPAAEKPEGKKNLSS